MKIGDSIQSGEQEAFLVPKGTVVEISNPDWDGDRPETHFNVVIELDEDRYVWTTSSRERITGKVLSVINKESPKVPGLG